MDTATNFEDTTLAVLDSADRIYYVATMDLLAIKNTKTGARCNELITVFSGQSQSRNNRNVKSGINMSDVEKILNYSIESRIT